MTLPPNNRWLLAWCILPSLCIGAGVDASSLRVNAGTMRVAGDLRMDSFTIGSGGTLGGSGSLSGEGVIEGCLSPGTSSYTNTATLHFTDSLSFAPGSHFECYARTHTDLDRLTVAGAVSGDCTVILEKALNAIPLDQVLIEGGPSSGYESFAAGGSMPESWLLTEAAPDDLLVTDILGDSDADTLPDAWENVYFGGRTNGLPGGDLDVDGMNNQSEYIAGTEPDDDTSLLQIISMNRVGPDSMHLAWSSVSDRSYSVKMFSLTSAVPTMVISNNIAGTAPVNSCTFSFDPEDGESGCYYLISVQ